MIKNWEDIHNDKEKAKYTRWFSYELTPDENKYLSYNQKVELLRFDWGLDNSDRKYHKRTTSFTTLDPELIITKQQKAEIQDIVDKLELTGKDREIAILYASGYSYDKIADQLNITKQAINNRFKRIAKKLDIKKA